MVRRTENASKDSLYICELIENHYGELYIANRKFQVNWHNPFPDDKNLMLEKMKYECSQKIRAHYKTNNEKIKGALATNMPSVNDEIWCRLIDMDELGTYTVFVKPYNENKNEEAEEIIVDGRKYSVKVKRELRSIDEDLTHRMIEGCRFRITQTHRRGAIPHEVVASNLDDSPDIFYRVIN